MFTDPTLARRPGKLTGWLVKGAAVLVVVLVAVVAFKSGGDAKPTGTSTSAKSFELPSLDGKQTVRLEDFRGKPTVVNLYASWCDVCDLEMPDYAKASKQLKGKVNFIGVASMETGDPKLMPQRYGVTSWPLARDVGGSNGSGLHDEYAKGFGLPITAFYDADGVLLRVHRGGLVGIDLTDSLNELYKIDIKI
jgi:cytochrome c biogenesis protein CcmG/thiol:disulfide interchange protein DsbE